MNIPVGATLLINSSLDDIGETVLRDLYKSMKALHLNFYSQSQQYTDLLKDSNGLAPKELLTKINQDTELWECCFNHLVWLNLDLFHEFEKC